MLAVAVTNWLIFARTWSWSLAPHPPSASRASATAHTSSDRRATRTPVSVPSTYGARAAPRRARQVDRRSPRIGHRSLQLPLPILHARGGAAVARARRDPELRGDHEAGGTVRSDGRTRRSPDRRRATRQARFPGTRRPARRPQRPARPAPHHQPPPTRTRAGNARSRRHLP